MNDSNDNNQDLDLSQQLAELEWDIQPERDLWPDISSRIRFADKRHKQKPWAPYAIAASTVIAAVSMMFSYMSYQMVQETNLNQEALALYQQAQLNLIEEQHQLVRVQFTQLLQNDRGTLNPEFVSEAEMLMANIDQASAEIKRAIELQPNNPDYASMLANTYQQELFLLKKVRLNPATSI